MSLAVALVLAALAQGQQAQTEQAEPASGAPTVLARDPHELPRADLGRWSEWRAEDPPAEELGPLLAMMVEASRRRDLPAAMAALYAVLEREPDYPPALHQLGVLYFRLQRYGDARTAFERFLAVAPGLVGQTRGLGHALYSLGAWEAAREHYRAVLVAEPEDVEARFGLALCRLRLGEEDAALAGLDDVLALDPEHAEATVWRAQLLFDQGRVEDALPAAERARDLDPYEPRPWFLLARVLLELGRDEDAEAARARFQELDSVAQETRLVEHGLLYGADDLARLTRLAELRARIGDVSGTRKALARALLVAPRDIGLRLWQLDLLEALGDEEGARVAALALEDVQPEEARAWEHLARFWGRRGDRERQVRAGERFLRLSGAGDPRTRSDPPR